MTWTYKAAIAAIFAALTCSLTVAPASAAPTDRDRQIERIVADADPKVMEVLVTTKDATGKPSFDTIAVDTLDAARTVIGQQLTKPGVAHVEMNQIVRATAFNDTYNAYQWALKPPTAASTSRLWADKIYAQTKGSPTSVVAVLDSGVEANHPDLKGRVLTTYNATSDYEDHIYDYCGHGTHVAGIIAAVANNRMGVAGLSPRTLIRPVRVLGDDCTGYEDDVAEGIMWAAQHGVKVINMSLGAYEPTYAEQSAVDWAIKHNVMVVAAIGNEGDGTANYPARYPGVVSVGASDQAGRRAPFSNVNGVDVVAPGVQILSTVPPYSGLPGELGDACDPSGRYCFLDGTSMATPFVSAAAAMAIARCGWSGYRTANEINRTATRKAGVKYPNSTLGYGLLNAARLVSCA